MKKKMIITAAALVLLGAAPALGQGQQAPIPPDVRDRNGTKTTATAIVCVADPNANPVTLVACGTGGGGGGTDPRVAQGSPTTGQTGTLTQATIVSGDQTWAAGETRPYTLTPSGRLKVDSTLPPGAATAAAQASYQGEIALTVGTASTVGRALKAACAGAGNINVTYTDGSTGIWPVAIGTQTLPLAITTVNASGTTATCTYANVK